MTPNSYCLALLSSGTWAMALYQGEVHRPWAPHLNQVLRFRVLLLTGDVVETTAVAPVPDRIVVLDDWREKRGRFAEPQPRGAA